MHKFIFTPCGLRGCNNGARIVSWPKVVTQTRVYSLLCWLGQFFCFSFVFKV